MGIFVSKASQGAVLAQRRIFLGGTFNPIHIGHARLLLETQYKLMADSATIIPTASPPQKQNSVQTFEHRFAMAKLVAGELNKTSCTKALFTASDCELGLDGPSYTLKTLKVLREKYPNDSLNWIIGMDNLVNLSSWYQWEELAEWANLVVFNRPGYECPTQGGVFEWMQSRRRLCEQPRESADDCPLDNIERNGCIIFLQSAPLMVSSTSLRHQIKNGLNPQYLLPESVFSYIQEHGLYC